MNFICDTKVLCSLINIQDRTLRDLVSKGIIARVARGKYDLRQALPAFVDYKLSTELGRHGTGALLAERTRLTKTQADSRQFELAISKEKYLFKQAVEETWANALAIFRIRLLSIEKSYSDDFADVAAGFVEKKNKRKITDKETKALRIEISQKLKKEIYTALKDLSNIKFSKR